jgi:hypothetical protein
MLCLFVRTTPCEMLSDVIACGLCHNNEWKLVYQISEWYGEKKSHCFGFEKPDYYNLLAQ